MSPRPSAAAVLIGLPGRSIDPLTRDLLRAGAAGVVIFARSIESPGQIRDLIAELHQVAGRRLWICVDQEGGAVQRLKAPATIWPPARAIGDAADPELARAVGRAMARELAAVGFNCNFAPVLDVNTNPKNPVIGMRALGVDAAQVDRVAEPLWRGMWEGGVLPVGKHFPGHGDTGLDSHFALPGCEAEGAALEEHLGPFRRAAAAGIPGLMSAHVVFRAIDPTLPATLSPAAGRLLRGEMGFDGVLFSDALEMKALADHWDYRQMGLAGCAATIDLFLVCHHLERTPTLLEGIDAFRASAEGEAAFARSLKRVDTALAALPETPPLDDAGLSRLLGCAAHQALADRLGAAAAGAVSKGVLG